MDTSCPHQQGSMGKRQTKKCEGGLATLKQHRGKKKEKAKRPAFTSTCNGTRHTVRAKGPEQAAMKIFRMNKSFHASVGSVTVFDEHNEHFQFPTSNWCSEGNPNKFRSK